MSTFHVTPALSAAALALMLSACGGSGGNSDPVTGFDNGSTAEGDNNSSSDSGDTGSGGSGDTGSSGDTPDDTSGSGSTPVAEGCTVNTENYADLGVGAYSVVGAIDTGTNPYHDFFQRGEDLPQTFLDAFGVTMTCALTTTGTYEERVAADRATCWDLIGQDDIVYFSGTRIIGSTMETTAVDGDATIADGELPILDEGGHGTNVTAAVFDADPDAIVYFVESTGAEASIDRAGLHPMVDIISTSFGQVAPVLGIEQATHRAVREQFKLHAGACANDATTCDQDATGGPPWSIGIAGFQTDGDGGKVTVFSGSTPDIVADWTQDLADAGTVDVIGTTSGTSFSTPRTAGTIGAALRATRMAAGDFGSGADPVNRCGLIVAPGGTTPDGLTNVQVRRAMQKAARTPSASEYEFDPIDSTLDGSAPVMEDTAYIQVGWGVVEPEDGIVATMVDDLTGVAVLPDRDSDTEDYMATRFANREAIWGPQVQ